ncbi:MAG TPA: hypothetical protein VH575_04610 [Gemmataceae bacterium]
MRGGLEPVVRTLLTREGYKLEIIGRPLAPLPPPDPDRLKPWDVLDHPLLDGVRHQERALIRYAAHQVDAVHLIAQVALAWPAQKMAVVATRIDQGRQVRDRLRAYGINAVAVNSENQPPEVGPVVVCTPAGLSHLPVNVAWLDIVLVLDAWEITSKLGMECIGHAWWARLFGLLEEGARPAPLERDFLTALFGFHEVVIPRHGSRERIVQVLRYPIRGGMILPAKQDVLAAKRRGLWHHDVRNRHIAKMVRSFREGRHDIVQKMFPEADARLTGSFSPDVVVLVENVEHALALSRRLPDWPVLTGLEVCKEGLPAEQATRFRPISPFGEARPLYAIVTSTAIGTLDLTHVGVLVRADGGDWVFACLIRTAHFASIWARRPGRSWNRACYASMRRTIPPTPPTR